MQFDDQEEKTEEVFIEKVSGYDRFVSGKRQLLQTGRYLHDNCR